MKPIGLLSLSNLFSFQKMGAENCSLPRSVFLLFSNCSFRAGLQVSMNLGHLLIHLVAPLT